MSPYVGLFFDILIVAALAATMYRAWTLSKQFNQLQSDRKAFEQLIQALNLAASRAEAAIRALKETTLESAESLQQKINAARGLSDELEIIVQAGDSLAERLEKLAEKNRKAVTSSAPEDAAAKTEAAPRTRAEKELMEALKAKQTS
jgi:tRNA(His) 5'-end guanylyltransferase